MKNKKVFQNRDIYERMNFLYQASTLMAGKQNILSAYYGQLLRKVGKKSVLRVEPEIKRLICRKCGLYLKSGITCDIDIDNQNQNLFIVKCNMCNLQKRFIINSKHKLWLESMECIVETYKSDQYKS